MTLLDCEEVKTSHSWGRAIKKWQEKQNVSQCAKRSERAAHISVASYNYLSSREWDTGMCILSLQSLTAPLRGNKNTVRIQIPALTQVPRALDWRSLLTSPTGTDGELLGCWQKRWMLTKERLDNWASCGSPECCWLILSNFWADGNITTLLSCGSPSRQHQWLL